MARELIKLNPEKFNDDFQNNKELVNELVETSSVKLRNRIAGYITRLLSVPQTEESEEEEMEPGEDDEEEGD